jgi:hypothetical protein
MTDIMRALDVTERQARSYMNFANYIMSEAAIEHESSVRFGFLPGGETTLVEADESAFGHFAVDEEDGTSFYWFVAVGVTVRGDPEKTVLEFLDPLPRSREHARLPKLAHGVWKRIAERLFPAGANIVLMTDSASAYSEVACPGIVDRHSVNHSELEFARSVEVLRNVDSRQMEPGTARTFIIDSEWKQLKAGVPKNSRVRSPADRRRVEYYIRAQQWRRLKRNDDLWPRYCELVRKWRSTSGNKYWDSGKDDEHDAMEDDSHAPNAPPEATGELSVEAAEYLSARQAQDELWGDRYFEKQSQGMCGQHALNNLLGAPAFNQDMMRGACDALLADTGDHRHEHMNSDGWYSHGVLAMALDRLVPPTFELLDDPLLPGEYDFLQDESIMGAIVGTGGHWSSIVKHAGYIWHVDSMRGVSLLDDKLFRALVAKHPATYVVAKV